MGRKKMRAAFDNGHRDGFDQGYRQALRDVRNLGVAAATRGFEEPDAQPSGDFEAAHISRMIKDGQFDYARVSVHEQLARDSSQVDTLVLDELRKANPGPSEKWHGRAGVWAGFAERCGWGISIQAQANGYRIIHLEAEVAERDATITNLRGVLDLQTVVHTKALEAIEGYAAERDEALARVALLERFAAKVWPMVSARIRADWETVCGWLE